MVFRQYEFRSYPWQAGMLLVSFDCYRADMALAVVSRATLLRPELVDKDCFSWASSQLRNSGRKLTRAPQVSPVVTMSSLRLSLQVPCIHNNWTWSESS